MYMPPVFIVGVNGSGTTMLADSLSRHPELYVLPDESRVLAYFASRYSDASLQDIGTRLRFAKELGSARAYVRVNGMQPVTLDVEGLTDCSFAYIVDMLYGYLAGISGKNGKRWCDKSPMYLQHIGLLAKRFPGSQFIHIYRDGRDSAQSFHRRWKQNPKRTIYRWKKSIREGREQGRILGDKRYMEVSYEQLTSSPESELKKICQFLSLDFHPAVLESSMQWMSERDRKAASGKIVKNSGKWRTYFSQRQVGELESIAGSLLKELGYEVKIDGDQDPGPVYLTLAKYGDWLKFSIIHFRDYGFGSLLPFFRKVRDALRQDAVNRY